MAICSKLVLCYLKYFYFIFRYIYGTKSPSWIAKWAAKNTIYVLPSYGTLPLNTVLIKNLYFYCVLVKHAARDATQQQHNITVRITFEVQSDGEGNHAPRYLVFGAAPTKSG